MNTTTQARRSSQRDAVLRILRLAGDRGVSNLSLTFDHRISQSATRIFELREEGWRIDSIPASKGDGSVVYVLRGRKESSESSNPTKSVSDCFEKRMTGLPLFDAGSRP